MINPSRQRFAVLLLPLLILAVVPAAFPIHQASGYVGVPGFDILSVAWGTATEQESPGPGARDVPLTVTLEYVYSEQANTINANLTLPSGFTDNDGNPTAMAYLSGPTSTGSTIQLTYYLDIASNVSLGVRTVPFSLAWFTGSGPTLTTDLQFTSISLPLEGTVSLQFNTSQTALVAGELNNISLSVENAGSGVAKDVSVAVSASTPSAVISQPSSISALGAGSSDTRIVSVFVPSSAAGSSVTLTISSSFIDPYNNTESSGESLSLIASSGQAKSNVLLEFATTGVPVASGGVTQVVLTVENVGTTAAHQISSSILASGGATVLAQPSVIESLAPGASTTETLGLYVLASAAGSAVSLTLDTSYLDINNNTDTSNASLGVLVGAAEVEFDVSSPTTTSLIPGQANTIVFDVTNVGGSAASDVIPSVSLSGQMGSVQTVSPSSIPSIAAGSTAQLSVALYVAPGAAGSIVDLSFSFSYTGPTGSGESPAQSIGAYVETTSQVFASTSLSLTSIENSVVSGETSTVSFQVTNTGTSTVYSPVFTLAASQPLVIVGNSTFSAIGKTLSPGQSMVFSAEVTASPSATSGIYSGTLTLSFTNQAGVPDTQTYSVALKLSGLIELVIQDEAVSQNATSVTVTGSILNEGSSSAYFSSVSGYIGASNATGEPDYVGEVDVNSPVPFTVTVPYQAPSSNTGVNVTLVVQYKDSLGEPQSYHSSESARLESLSQIVSTSSSAISSSPSGAGPSVLELSIVLVAAFVAVGVGVGVFLRRRGRPGVRLGGSGKRAEDETRSVA